MKDPNDDLGKFSVRFCGEIGSAAHQAHHETLMARLGARTSASEVAWRRKVTSAVDQGLTLREIAKSYHTTVASVRSAVKAQRHLGRVSKNHRSRAGI